MPHNIKVSVVSYLNSKPFLYGLNNYKTTDKIDVSLDTPAICAKKLIEEKVDIGLVPVAIIPLLKEHYVISDYCIGAYGKVGSVILYSKVPLPEIKTVLLDYQSRTSVTLVKILAKHLWNIAPVWKNAEKDFETTIKGTTAAVIIGDRTFGLENKYPFTYDLADEWKQLTGLPFVFACWVSNKKLNSNFLFEFNNALKYGVNNRPVLITELLKKPHYSTDIKHYLTKQIQYKLDSKKKKAMKLFLGYISTLEQ